MTNSTFNILNNQEITNNFSPKIVVIGIGGAGLNAVNNMILSKLQGVNFVVTNTDCQSLGYSLADKKIQLGVVCTKGLGAGARPEIGKQAAEESSDVIEEVIKDADMVFIASGMGGGTGTGASPVIANIAKKLGILTVGVVTKPFSFEGPRRMMAAESGIAELEKIVDTLIVVSNQNLMRMATEKTSLAESFKMADDVLYNSVRCVAELLTKPGFINRDFADLKTVIGSMGRAMIGYGEATGDNRHTLAVENAITNHLLENFSIEGAKSVLINITGGLDMGLMEVQDIADAIRSRVNEDANIIFGTVFDENKSGSIMVSIVATGMPCVLKSNEKKIVSNNQTQQKTIIENTEEQSYPSTVKSHFNNQTQNTNNNHFHVGLNKNHFNKTQNPEDFNAQFESPRSNEFAEDEINENEEFEILDLDGEQYRQTAIDDMSNIVDFRDYSTKKQNSISNSQEKKKRPFLENNSLNKNAMPLFSKTYDTLYSIGKSIFDDNKGKSSGEQKLQKTISEWQIDDDSDDSEFDKPSITRSA